MSCVPLLCLVSSVAGQAAHDNFADRGLLAGTNVVLQGTTWNSTREAGDPNDLTKSVWWTWTSPLDGVAALWVGGEPGIGGVDGIHRVVCRVMVGSQLGSLTLLAGTQNLREGGRTLFPVQSGQTYQLCVGTPVGISDSVYPGRFTLILQAGVSPDNDSFARSRRLEGASVMAEGENRLSDVEPGEPFSRGQSGAWWHWTAQESGNVVVTVLENSSSEQVVSSVLLGGELDVFEGDTVSSLDGTPAWLEFSRNQPVRLQKAFLGLAGHTYRIRVGGYFGLAGRFQLNLAQTLPPHVRVMEPRPGQVFHADDLIPLAAEAIDLDGRVREVEFVGSWANSTWHQRSVAPYRLQAALPPGFHQVYARAVDDRGSWAESTPVEFVVRPANDDFARRQGLKDWPIDFAFAADAATREEGEPVGGLDASVWWTWKANRTGRMTLSVTGGLGLHQFSAGVYVGSELRELRELIAVQSAFAEDLVQLPFAAEAGVDYVLLAKGGSRLRLITGAPPAVQLTELSTGQPYLLRETLKLRCLVGNTDSELRQVIVSESIYGSPIAFWTNSTRDFELSVPLETLGSLTFRAEAIDENGLRGYSSEIRVESRLSPPINDAFVNRIPLKGAPVRTNAVIFAAASEPGDPLGGSVWWSWTPEISGTYTLSVRSPASPYFELYEGTDLSQLSLVGQPGCFDSSCVQGRRLTVEAKQGTTYALAVRGDSFYPGPTEISILRGAPPSVRWVRVRAQRVDTENVRMSVAMDVEDPDGDLERVELRDIGGVIAVLRQAPFATNLTVKLPTGPDGEWLNLAAVAVDAQGLENPLDFVRVWAGSEAIPNDDFADRTRVTGTPVSLSAPLQGGSGEPERPELGRPVWWEWTPQSSGTYSIVLRRRDGFAELRVFEGDTLVSLSPVPVQLVDSTQVFEAQAGRRYQLAMEGNGHATFEILASAPPRVELVLPMDSSEYREGDPIRVVANATDDGAVRRVDVILDGLTVGSVREAPFELEFTASARSWESDLKLIAVDDQGIPAYSRRVFVKVLPRSPGNDNFLNRAPIQGTFTTVAGSLKGASLEPFESQQPDLGSVWWTWQAPGSGPVWLLVSGASSPLEVDVYCGDDPAQLVRVDVSSDAQDPLTSRFLFAGQRGKQYQIRCSGTAPFGSDLKFSLVQDYFGVPEITRTQGGELRIQMADSIERLWQVDASEDLVSWHSVGELRSRQGSLVLGTTAPLERPHFFYRFRRD